MKSNSRFTKIAVASGLIVASGAAVLGITGFASAELAPKHADTVAIAQESGSDSNSITGVAGNDAVSAQAIDGPSVNGQAIDGQAPDHMGGPKFVTDGLAKVLGLSVTDLQTQLQTKSLADIAKAQNVDIDKVKDAILAEVKAHLDAEVKAGDHTQAEADQKLADVTAKLDTMVNNVRPAGGPRMGGDRGGHGMGGHGMRGHGDGDGDGPMGAMNGTGGPLGGDPATQGASFSA